MTTALLIGSAVGALLGLFHGGYVYRRELADARDGPTGPIATRLRAGYYAFWTLGLWVLLGSYVLSLWLTGCVLYLICKAISGLRSA